MCAIANERALPVPPLLASRIDLVSAGFAALAGERSLAGVSRMACVQAAKLPGVSGVALLRPDDRGMIGAVYAIPTGIPAEVVSAAVMSLHQHWIASHAPVAAPTGLGPYAVDDRPELIVIPLVAGDHLHGGMLFAGQRGVEPASSPADRIAACAICTLTVQAFEAIALRQRLETSISRVDHEAELTSARKAISRELHDGPTQDLALAGLALDRLIALLGADQAVSADARQARDLIDRAVLGMRKAIGKLRSVDTPAPSITGPLRELLAEMDSDATGVEIDFQHVSGVRLAPEVERAMIGIVREALHNVRKHANADSVRLEVRRFDDAVEVAVVDDGIGFQGDAPAGHFGLEQIRELAEETGGKVNVGSSPGSGTTVRAWIPLPGGHGEMTNGKRPVVATG